MGVPAEAPLIQPITPCRNPPEPAELTGGDTRQTAGFRAVGSDLSETAGCAQINRLWSHGRLGRLGAAKWPDH